MTKQHPLTDKQLFIEFLSLGRDYYPDNRNGFSYDDMRAVADWQLEQVIEYIRADQWFGEPEWKISRLRAAMRPTITQENN